MADRWAWSPLTARAVPVSGVSKLSAVLNMPHTIPDMVHEWSLLCLFDSINSRVSSIDSLIWPFHSFL
jgi:hypothetical protein